MICFMWKIKYDNDCLIIEDEENGNQLIFYINPEKYIYGNVVGVLVDKANPSLVSIPKNWSIGL